MPPPYSYTFWQQVLPFLRGSWVHPPGDQVADRRLNTAKVAAAEPFAWPAELRSQQVSFDAGQPPWEGSVAGFPIQRVPARDRQWRTWTENNTYTGRVTQRLIPVPQGNVEWVEGNPNADGAWDRHVLLVCPETREAWELIRANPDLRTCLVYAHWIDGKLVEGMPVNAGQVMQTGILLGRDDPPHRMGLAMTNYVGWDGTMPESSGWPRCGDVFRLRREALERIVVAAGATAEQRAWANAAHVHGFVLYDRGGKHAFVQQAGTRWADTSLRQLAVTLGDLERVTASTP
jgi:hypothetical protein